MPPGFSTGRKPRIKYSTASDPGPVIASAPDYPRPRYSTGGSASIAHFPGRGTGGRALDGGPDAAGEKAEGVAQGSQGRSAIGWRVPSTQRRKGRCKTQ